MALPLKKSEMICFCDIQYRWSKRSTNQFVEVCVELNEFPQGQMIIAQCPRIFRDDMVEDVIEKGRELGWKPDEVAEAMNVRLTKRGLKVLA